MCLKQELKHRSKNTNPKIKNLKITIFSNPAISLNPKNPAKSISFKRKLSKPISFSQTQQNPSHLKANPANPSHFLKPSKPSKIHLI